MNHRADWTPMLLIAAGALALGALAMYVFDPQQGRRRRALARHRVLRAGLEVGNRVSGRTKDLQNRVQGLVAEASGALRDAVRKNASESTDSARQ